MAGGGTKQAGDERALLIAAPEPVYAPLPACSRGEARSGTARRALAPANLVFRMPRLGHSTWRAALLAEEERGTAFLFVPVFLALGALAYFAWPTEPGVSELVLLAATIAGAIRLARERVVARYLLIALLLAVLGMLAGKAETWRAGTKVLGGEITTRVTGRVVRIEHRANGRVRLTMDLLETVRPKLRYAPDRIRATARKIPEELTAGDGIGGLVRLRGPSGPVRPQSYDFAFENYFDGIGANGFFLTDPEPAVLATPAPFASRLSAWLEGVRNGLANRIRANIGGVEGEIAAALIAGVTAGIPEEANEALRASGLYHVISISGLHMALVAGTVMVSLRSLFALFPVFASRRPVKKYAATIALGFVFFYLFLSGAEVATQRSFIMLAVMLAALLFDRAALTMRNLAIAAIIVIAISPHEVAGPSFQMSFAATAALVAAYAAWSERRAKNPPLAASNMAWTARLVRLAMLYVVGIAVTSMVAGVATALFGAWHFHRIASLGLPANLVAMPVISLLVMLPAVAAVTLMPFGLEGPALTVMGEGIRLMMAIATWFAERAALDHVGIVPLGAVICFTIALVLLTLTTTLLRVSAAPFLLAGAMLLASREMPDVLVSEDARLVAMAGADGALAVNRGRPNAFTIENWTGAMAARTVVKPAAAADRPTGAQAFACDDGLCIARHGSGALVAHAADAEAARRVCNAAALIVIDDATAGQVCVSDALVITKRDLARHGSAEAFFHQAKGSVMAEVRFAITETFRPWHSHRAFSREARGLPPFQRKDKANTMQQDNTSRNGDEEQ